LKKNSRKKIGSQYGARLGDGLLIEKIAMNENIMVTEKGIRINYLPYEIASYAMGEIFYLHTIQRNTVTAKT